MPSVSTALAMAMIGKDYQYLGELGAGGGGTVVLARHVAMNRLVAVKAVAASSGTGLARLKREGRVLAALDNPSILNVFRMVEDGAVLALITEYMEGGDFEDALNKQRLSGHEVVAVLVQVGSALQAAHAAGVVHRDIKPTNVLLGRDDRIVLADFGLSRLGGEFRTHSGAITGTPLYMPPEQITSPDAEAPTLDVYSFGAVVYRALTGRPPFVASDLKTLADLHLSGVPEPPDQVRTGIPKSVSRVVLGMLAKNPKDRPSLQQVATTLTRVRPEVWDEVLPEARETAPRKPLPNEVAVSTTVGDGTEGGMLGGTAGGTEGGDEPGSAPSVPAGVDIDPLLLKSVEQPVFKLKRTRKPPQVLLVAAGILAGLLIGIIVLLLI